MTVSGRHALIIEDEILIALEVESLLAEMGFQTFDWADSPGRALACAKDRKPDLITADIRIVGGTGIEAVKAIHAEVGPVPVVYVTGNVDMLRDQGSPTVVEKPIAPAALAAACEQVFRSAA